MNKIEVEIPAPVQNINNATNGLVACAIMLVVGIVTGLFGALKCMFSGIFRVAAGAVAGGCAAAQSK